MSPHQGFMERRAIPRKPVLMSGAIQFAGCAINCLVRNMTISGAALDVTEPHDIPERFNLVLSWTARTFPATSSGATRSGSAWPSTNPPRSSSCAMSQIGTKRTSRARKGPTDISPRASRLPSFTHLGHQPTRLRTRAERKAAPPTCTVCHI